MSRCHCPVITAYSPGTRIRMLIRMKALQGKVCMQICERMLTFSLLHSVKDNVCVYSLSPHEQTTRREHVGDLVRITGQQEERILWQMEDRHAGVGEGQDGRYTKPSSPTGRECTISQGAKLGSPAKARHSQAEWGCMWLFCGIPRLKMRRQSEPLIYSDNRRMSEADG